jgi:ferredoxin
VPRLTIDHEKCLNSGQCAYMQPELFELDDDGAPVIRVEPVEGELIARAQDAIAMCPGQAISFIEGEQNGK